MKIFLHLSLCLAFSCCFAQEKEAPTAAVELSWHTEEQAAKADAKSQGKPILMYFSADWCDFCKTMDNETLKKPKVSDYLNKEFILFKVDYENSKDLVARYQIRGVPAMVIGDPELKKVEQTSGFMPQDVFLAWAEMTAPNVSPEALAADAKAELQFAVDISRSFREGFTEDQYAAIDEFYGNFAKKDPEALKFAESHLTDEIKHNPGRFSRFLKNEKLHVRILTSNAFAKIYGKDFNYDPWDLSRENYERLETFLENNNISSLLEDLINF